MRKHRITMAILLGLAAVMLPAVLVAADKAMSSEKVVVAPLAGLKWTAGPVPGVSIAAVEGDMAKGPSHFFLKYDAGFVAPMHHHSPDHYVMVVSGTLVLTAEGKEHRLVPGSYLALTGKAKHAARVEGKEAAVMFIDARGPWDAVLEEAPAAK